MAKSAAVSGCKKYISCLTRENSMVRQLFEMIGAIVFNRSIYSVKPYNQSHLQS